jgi:GNAT superfamily N-acetyltransferase
MEIFVGSERQIEVYECANKGDEEESLRIANTVWPLEAVTMAEVDSFKSSVREHCDFLAVHDGSAVGSAVAAILPQRSDLAFVLVTVLEDRRRLGAGTALYEAVSAWAAHRSLDPLWAPVEEDDAESVAYAVRRSFVEFERNPRMVLDLTTIEEPLVAPPAGVEITTWAKRPDLAEGIYEVAVEAYADVPGAEDDEMESFEDWLEHDMRGSGDRPDATFVAIAGEEVVGYAKFSLTEARPTAASHDMTGVKRAWRGRGIARALKCAQISWATQAGFTTLQTSNEVRNAPIRHLNAELGYKPAPGRVLMQGPRAAP